VGVVVVTNFWYNLNVDKWGSIRYLKRPRRCIMSNSLEKEFTYYLDHQAELVKKFNGKFIVIKGGGVLGSYDSEIEAIKETEKEHELGTFLVQKCEPGDESYTQTYHSRVSF
jgi:hypothetical protein